MMKPLSAEGIGLTEWVTVLPDGSVLVDRGPMRMFILVSEHGRPLVELAKKGGDVALQVLEDLARSLPVVKRKACDLRLDRRYPAVVQRMVEATQQIEEPDLTPLAAVAGAASDVVADYIFGQGGTKVIVDNGGDIAIRLREGERANVGVRTAVDASRPSYLLSIHPDMGVGGIATSGFGGRSFTKGIATAATALSRNASLADAAATVIGNFTRVDDPVVKRDRAEKIYADTDIPGEWVTTAVGDLSQEKTEEALQHGLAKAQSIQQRDLIKGALIAFRDQIVWTDSLNPFLKRL